MAIGGLLEHLRGRRELADVPNIVYSIDGKIVKNKRAVLSDVNKVAYWLRYGWQPSLHHMRN